jgi:hypothetical protein
MSAGGMMARLVTILRSSENEKCVFEGGPKQSPDVGSFTYTDLKKGYPKSSGAFPN